MLHNFTGPDGAVPHGVLITDAAGNLYGTTHNGVTSGYGTVFQLTPSGTLNVLHSFIGGGDGAYPEAGLIADMAGNLYGTTYGGGAGGQGTVFQLTPAGTLYVLYSFTGGSDGGRPGADLIADAAGNLYGTTSSGGATASCPGGCGTVFELTVPVSFKTRRMLGVVGTLSSAYLRYGRQRDRPASPSAWSGPCSRSRPDAL